ncbi:MAG TPA: nuclear transport factor 2 family protein [Nocardioides sp.]|nr:nuclear transport factor 2 family protein [Nocardioides sp.]
MTTTQEILDLGAAWARAEQSGDVATLDAMAADGFRLVGPFGFVLDKHQWLERYRTGDLTTTSLAWDDVSVADHGDVAIAIGKQTQQASYLGRPADGVFRVTHVFARDGHDWRLLGMHLSQAAPPAPPRP